MPYCRGQITRIRQCSGCVEVTVAGEAPGSFPIDNCCFAMIVDPDGPELLGPVVADVIQEPNRPLEFPLHLVERDRLRHTGAQSALIYKVEHLNQMLRR